MKSKDRAANAVSVAGSDGGSALGAGASRSMAVQHIANGTAIAAGGLAAFLGGSLLPLSTATYLVLVVGGVAIAGCGVLTAGRGASHLLRFGEPGSSNLLLTATGLGASITSFAATHALLVLGVEPVVRALHNLSMLGVVGFGTLLLILMVKALVGLATEPSTDPPT